MVDRSPIPMTADGLEKLRAEYEQLTSTGRRDMSRRIQAARELGDLRENAEYDTAKNDQGLMEARIRQLEDILRRAQVIDSAASGNGKAVVTIGSTVVVKLDGEEETYTIVGPVEARPREGRISNESPVGKALLGRRAGEKFDITMPNGTQMPAVIKSVTTT